MMRFFGPPARLRRRLTEAARILRRDRRGNFTIMFAFSAVVLVVFIGMGIDFLDGLSFKSRWDTAADAAALAAIQGAEAYITANSASQTTAALDAGATAAGQAQGLKSFAANAGASEASETVTPSLNVTPSGGTINVTVTYTGTVATHFGGLVGISTLSIAGKSAATATMTTYINYYIAVDISQSMGIGATATDQTNLFNLTKSMGYTQEGELGCVFGCHVPINGSQYSNEYVAHSVANPPITLRIDAAKTAIQDVITQAKQYAGSSGNISIALYTMQLNPFQNNPKLVSIASPPSNDYSNLTTLANSIDLGPNTSVGLGDSDFEDAMTELTSELPANGNGLSPSTPLNYVLLITDGVMDIPCASWNGHCAGPMLSYYCTPLQAKATVGVVYTTYLPVYVNNNPANDFEQNYKDIVAPFASSIEPGVQACATNTGLFFQADDGPALISALQSLFQSTLASARLTQ